MRGMNAERGFVPPATASPQSPVQSRRFSMFESLKDRTPPTLDHALWVLPGLLLLGVLFGSHGPLELLRLGKEKTRLENAIAEQERHNRELRRTVRRLRDDPEYLERLAREEIGLVRPNEVVYQFPE